MPLESKVNEFLDGLREEEKRLKAELSDAETRVTEIKAELSRAQSGIKGLAGKDASPRKRKKAAKASQDAPASSSDECHTLVEESVPS